MYDNFTSYAFFFALLCLILKCFKLKRYLCAEMTKLENLTAQQLKTETQSGPLFQLLTIQAGTKLSLFLKC